MTPPTQTAAPTGPPAAGAAVTPRPGRAPGVELLGALRGSGYEQQPSLVRRGDGQTLQLTPLLYALLELVDGRRDHDELASLLSERAGKVATAEDVAYLIEHKLQPLGVLAGAAGDAPVVEKANPLLALRWRLVVSNPRVTRRITRPFAALLRPYVAVPLLAVFAVSSGWLLFSKGLASALHQALYEPGMLLLVFALTLLSAGFHEFGHAAACRYGGATPGAIGVGLYLVWPAFYTDVTDSYRLGRWGRLRVDLGGLYFNAIFAVGMFAAWLLTRSDALLLLIPAQLLQMVRQLLPFVRFDGYHVLADLTGVPDLFAHLGPTVSGLLPHRWRRTEPRRLKRWARVVVRCWVLLVIPVLALSLALMVTVLPRVAATAWDSLAVQAAVLGRNWTDRAYTDVGVRLLSMVTIALPLVSTVYLLARIVRRTVRRAWRATDGRPRLRAAAVGLGVAIAALVLWSWWPQGQYKPISRHERGTLPQTLQPVLSLTHVQPLPPAPTAVEAAGEVPAAFTLAAPAAGFAPVDAPPEEVSAQPRLGFVFTPRKPTSEGSADVDARPIVVLAPLSAEPAGVADRGGADLQAAPTPTPAASATPAPTATAAANEPVAQTQVTAATPPAQQEWPFSFDPPRDARPQDNQARAVNTQDGATVYDVAFALVWVTDGQPVDQRNDAYALASCRECTTVAVAFQVVLVVDHSDVVVPENVAVAVNEQCEGCSTYALALQLVATLTDQPSDAGLAKLEAIWDYVERLEAEVHNLPPDQIHAHLESVEAAILQILDSDDGAVARDGAGEGFDPAPASPSPSPWPTPSPTAGAPAGSGEPDPTPSATPSPTPASEDEAAGQAAPEPSEAPSAQPTPAPSGQPEPAETTQPQSEAPTPAPTNPEPTADAGPEPSEGAS